MDTKRVEDQTIRDCIYSGAIHGIIAWTIYAIVECWFSSILPWLIKPGYAYMPLHWGFTVLLFVLYPIFGLILGGLSGIGIRAGVGQIQFLQKLKTETLFPAMAIFSVVLVFIVNLVPQLNIRLNDDLYVLPPLSVSLLLTIALVSSAGSSIWFRRLRFLTNPWTTSIVLLGLPWIKQELLGNHTMVAKVGATLAYPVFIFLVSFIFQVMLEKRRIGRYTAITSVSQVKHLAFLILFVFVFLGISLFLDQEHPRLIQDLKSSLQSTNKPNVILITMDTVRADHLSLYGYERDTTPNLKKFAEEATLYTRAIASGDMTLSTHASIFTGMYARKHGVHYDSPDYPSAIPLDDKFYTLAEILSKNGYLTMGIVANHAFLSRFYGFDQGFQYYDQQAPVVFLGKTEPYYIRQGIRNVLKCFSSPSSFDMLFLRSEDINREVFTLLKKVKKNNDRFFLFVNYMDAHDPYIPPPPFDTLYPGKDKTFTLARYRALEKEVLKLERKVTEKERNHLVSQYDGEIAYLDFHLGRLIVRLKELGLYENCIIIITSDHGEAFGERDLIQHQVSVYQDLVHIPLIIKSPNSRQKIVVNELVSVVDLMPTILDVLGDEIAENIQGESLLGLEPGKARNVISESFPNGYLFSWHSRFRRVERAIFSENFKFISSTRGKRELYDLSKDPNERNNLYKAYDPTSLELEARLNQWLKDTKEESGTAAKLDKDALDRLKTLGYIQ